MNASPSVNPSIWTSVKSASGIEQYVPRIIDIDPSPRDKRSKRSKYLLYLLCFLCILLILAIILLSILLPILLRQKPVSINATTIFPSTTQNLCVYPNVFSSAANRCVNILLDSNNCGGLGIQCPTNSSCSAGVCSDAPGIQLNNSIAIFSSAVNGTADDQMFNVTLPWNITLYNSSTSRITVTTNGVLCFGQCSTIYTETTLPTASFSNVTVFPFWDDLYIYSNTSQGIYYQSDGSSPNRTLRLEFYMSHYLQPRQYYHFQVIFFENAPNIVRFRYFQASDGGLTCTIGVQVSGTGPFILYSFDQANSVQSNMMLTFNTNLGTFNKTLMA